MMPGLRCQYGLVASDGTPTRVLYRAFVTGSPNSLDDLDVVMSSFQMGLYSGTESYMTMVTPYSVDMLAALNARPDGELVIIQAPQFAAGPGADFELARMNFSDYTYQRGARSAAIQLSGTRQRTNTSPTTIALTDALLTGDGYRLMSSGQVDFYLNPMRVWPSAGDTVTYDGNSFRVDRVSYSVRPDRHSLSLTTTPL